MEELGNFPFGENIVRLTQKDRSPKRFFLIGSYASAVHALWFDLSGKMVTRSLAVANEPEILWAGNSFEALTVITRVKCPLDAGRLTDAGKRMNGGIGRLFHSEILKPLNIFRSDVWFSLLIPFTIANKGQRKALNRYNRSCEKFRLPPSSILPSNIKTSLITEKRISDLIEELEESKAEIIITLGDLPLHHFIKLFNPYIDKLDSFERYGQIHDIKIKDKNYRLLPFYHPKSGENIGAYTEKWRRVHFDWKRLNAPEMVL